MLNANTLRKTAEEHKNVLALLTSEQDLFSNNIIYSIEDILKIHNYGIQRFGGSYGIQNKNLLQSVCFAPYKIVSGKEVYPTIFHKAAKYLYDFTHYEIFSDGNKRTGLLACVTYLKQNGFSLQMSEFSAYDLVVNIAKNHYTSVEEIAEILVENVIPKVEEKINSLKQQENELEM